MSGPYTQPLVYFFGQGRADGTAAMKDVLGGKGAGLAEMTTIGIPVPPGFTIASSLCLSYLESHQFPKRLQAQVENALQRLEAATGKHFGDGDNPLLVSRALGRRGLDAGHDGDDPQPRPQRRHGRGAHPAEPATRSSPGTPTAASCRCTAAWCSICRGSRSSSILEEHRQRCGVERDIDLPVEEMQAIVRRFKEHVRAARPAATSPTIRWTSSGAPSRPCSRAGTPAGRSTTGSCTTFPTRMGTAVNVVAMVFGNLGEDSGTGVAFSRDPSTGEQRALRRVPAQRPGRGRGLRQPDAAADRDAQGPAAGVVPGAGAGGPHARAALPRRAGHGVHHRARHALHAADPPGPALGPRRGAHRLRDGGRGADLRGGGRRPHPAQRPQPAAPSRPSTRTAGSTCSPPACPPRRAPPAARSCSTPTGPSSWAARARR